MIYMNLALILLKTEPAHPLFDAVPLIPYKFYPNHPLFPKILLNPAFKIHKFFIQNYIFAIH